MWPIHPQRLKDELLSSWILRIAQSFGIKLHTFTSLAFPGFEFWNRDIDKNAQPELLDLITKNTGRPRKDVERATLATYSGYLFSGNISSGYSRWIMQVGVYHRTHRLNGLSYCPYCLKEDKVPYFRRSWRVAFSVACIYHHVLMRNCCPKCGAAVTFFRHDFKDRNNSHELITSECFSCNFDLREASSTVVESVMFQEFINKLYTILENGVTECNGSSLYSVYYFDVIYQLLKLVTVDKYGVRLRKVIEDEVGNNVSLIYPKSRHIEMQPIEIRINGLKLLSWLMNEWPDRFIFAIQKADLTRCRLVKDMEYIPFWYDNLLSNNWENQPYIPSVQEIQSAYYWLESNEQPVTKIALLKILGLKDSKLVKKYLSSKK